MPKIHGPIYHCFTSQTLLFALCNSRAFVRRVQNEVVQHTHGCVAHWLINTLHLRKNHFSWLLYLQRLGNALALQKVVCL